MCKLDRKAPRPCSSLFERKLKTGRHAFSVWAVNAQGVADRTPARFGWTVLRAKSRRRHRR
jgi:hypothetical protein